MPEEKSGAEGDLPEGNASIHFVMPARGVKISFVVKMAFSGITIRMVLTVFIFDDAYRCCVLQNVGCLYSICGRKMLIDD